MNVPKYETCQELEQLSGWRDCDYLFVYSGKDVLDQPTHTPTSRLGLSPDVNYDHLVSAYDLSYILDRLPMSVSLIRHTGSWYATADIGMGKPYIGYGNTAVEAAAQLAIAVKQRRGPSDFSLRMIEEMKNVKEPK